MSNEKKIIAISAMASNFGTKIEKNLLITWIKLLNNYNSDIVEQACMNVIENYEYKTLPPFAVLKKEIDKITGNSKEARKNIPAECWLEIEHALERSPNKDKQPEFSIRTQHALRRIGGWYNLCLVDNDSLKWKKKEFLEVAENALDIQDNMLAIDGNTNKQIEHLVKSIGSFNG